jgi:magnesium-protoporphyrin O-methyltransferase
MAQSTSQKLPSYEKRRGELETYFDRTAVDAWAKLTSTAPVGRIRATVRAGRDEMRETILGRLPQDLSGRRILDAGCGTGALAVELARRGADVVAIDLSATLVSLAKERLPHQLGRGSIDFRVGDMLDPQLGQFDHIVAMDSLIHYRTGDVVSTLAALGNMTKRSILFTFAPLNLFLGSLYIAGKFIPGKDASPRLVPVSQNGLFRAISRNADLFGWGIGETQRVSRSFYISQMLELVSRESNTASPQKVGA